MSEIDREELVRRFENVQAREVGWYLRHGRYIADRLKLDANGCPFVIGDWSWQRAGYPEEVVEPIMHEALGLAVCRPTQEYSNRERDADILKRRQEGQTFEQIGDDYNVSRQRIEQICRRYR